MQGVMRLQCEAMLPDRTSEKSSKRPHVKANQGLKLKKLPHLLVHKEYGGGGHRYAYPVPLSIHFPNGRITVLEYR